MASKLSSDSDSASSRESEALCRHSGSLVKAISDPCELSWKLFSSKIIDGATRDKANLPTLIISEKNNVLVSAVVRRVEARPNRFHCFVDILKDDEDDVLRDLGGKLEATYNKSVKCPLKQFTHDTKEQTPSPTKSVQHSPLPLTKHLENPPADMPHRPLTKQLDSLAHPQAKQSHFLPTPANQTDCLPPPPATHPSLSLLPPRSAVCDYADYLKAFYQTSELPSCDKWPPSPSETFINLAVISREKLSSKDLETFMLATLHGGVDQITDVKAPIEIGEILNSQPGKMLQCVLVEGAPGVGKTTLAWEACKQWGKGNLFQQFAIIMLLRLRDQSVQNANSITDLVFDQDQDCQQDISKYLKDTKGRNILIILEGLDELPNHLLTQSSFFSQILSGKLLPCATILVTSRPSATAYLWKNWKHRISRHIEVLGFTEENITQYIASVLSPQELRGFQNYLSINPHIRTIMYIPLHAAIVIEVYRMCQDSSRILPTTITELYTCFVQTVLLRYLTSHTQYKDEQIDLDKLTNLPPPVYDLFYDLTRLAYKGVTDRQLIFKHQQHAIQHLGFMDSVTELFPNKLVSYSYNFLHLSIQEYLAAYYISTMEIYQQEKLLRRMCAMTHLRNVGRFLAGITKFKDMNRTIVKENIVGKCESTVYVGWVVGRPIRLSANALQLLYESGDASILDGNQPYECPLTDLDPLFDFSILGYCISHSNCKWRLWLGTQVQCMKSKERIKMLVHTLKTHSNSGNTYNIEEIYCFYDDPECVEQLLTMPANVFQQLQTLWLLGHFENPQPLSQLVPKVALTMRSLRSLVLHFTTGAKAVFKTVQAVARTNTLERFELLFCDINEECITTLCQWLSTFSQLAVLNISLPSPNAVELVSTALATNSTLKSLGLQGSKFNIPAMQALCSMLAQNSTITKLRLLDCHIDDDLICCLAKALHGNKTITDLDVMNNSISDRGAVYLAKILKINNTVEYVNLSHHSIGNKGLKSLREVTKTNKHIFLKYTEPGLSLGFLAENPH